MLFYGRIAFLCLPFTISTLAANLPPTLQLGNEGPSTGHDITQPNSEVHCTPNTTADSLSTFSCSNAWNKIVSTTPPVIYSKRPGAGGTGDVSLPVRYLSGESCPAAPQVCTFVINIFSDRREQMMVCVRSTSMLFQVNAAMSATD